MTDIKSISVDELLTENCISWKEVALELARRLREQEQFAINYLRQVEDVKCALCRNPQEHFDVGNAIDLLRGQKEQAEAALEQLTARCAMMKIKLERLGSMEAFDVSRAVDSDRDAELLMRIEYARETISNLPASVEKLLADVRRYKWMRENWAYSQGIIFFDEFNLGPLTTLDEAIDSAIKEKP